MRRLILALSCLALAGCSGQGLFDRRVGTVTAPTAPATAPAPTQPTALPSAAPPEVDESALGTGNPFGTAIVNPDEDGGPAAAAEPSDGRIGTTVATLGDPGQSGFWLKTPLVSAATSGRVVYVGSGRSVQVQLLPLDGPSGGGSQISMAAMRLLEAPLTGLPELVVYTSS